MSAFDPKRTLSSWICCAAQRPAAAFSLLKFMDAEVRNDLVFSLSANVDLSREAWRVLINFPDAKLNFSTANEYAVEIYYAPARAAAKEKIVQQLHDAGFKGKIVSQEVGPGFWDNYEWPDGNEVRFDPKADSIAMKYLYRFINAKNPGLKFQEVRVQDDSRPSSISIHLASEQPPKVDAPSVPKPLPPKRKKM
jgi:hypothetical protein